MSVLNVMVPSASLVLRFKNVKIVKEKERSIFDKDPCKFKCAALPVKERERLLPVPVFLAQEKEWLIETNLKQLAYLLELIMGRIYEFQEREMQERIMAKQEIL